MTIRRTNVGSGASAHSLCHRTCRSCLGTLSLPPRSSPDASCQRRRDHRYQLQDRRPRMEGACRSGYVIRTSVLRLPFFDEEPPVRRVYECTILAGNWWPRDGRELTPPDPLLRRYPPIFPVFGRRPALPRPGHSSGCLQHIQCVDGDEFVRPSAACTAPIDRRPPTPAPGSRRVVLALGGEAPIGQSL